MSQSDLIRKLLRHGPLSYPEITEITGIKPNVCAVTLSRLEKFQLIKKRGRRRQFVYFHPAYPTDESAVR